MEGQTDVDLEDYVKEILASGFPGLRGLAKRLARAQLDGHIDRDFDERGRKVLAVEAKLGQTPDERDVRHLNWLRDEPGGDELADAIIVTTGTTTYRRADGIAVIPAVLLGP